MKEVVVKAESSLELRSVLVRYLTYHQRVTRLTFGTILVLAVVISIAIFSSYRVNQSNREKISDNEINGQLIAEQLVAIGKLTNKVDTLEQMVLLLAISNTESAFNTEENNTVLKNKVEEFISKKKVVAVFNISKSQNGNFSKMLPNKFIPFYQTMFDNMFEGYNLTKPYSKKYQLAKIISTAQGAIESSWGGSTLANKYNNWHGIKCQACGGSLQKKCNAKNSVAYNDDCDFDKFHVYKNASESVAQHYTFVFSGKKYKIGVAKALEQPALATFLKDDNITDADFWKSDVGHLCKLLSAKGYATSKHYPNSLKALILNHRMYDI